MVIKISCISEVENHFQVYANGKRYTGGIEGMVDFVRGLDPRKMDIEDPALPPVLDLSELPNQLKYPVLRKILDF